MIRITLTDRLGRPIHRLEGEKELVLTLNRSYGFEDILLIECPPKALLEVDLDPWINQSIIYTPSGKISYQIPEGPKRQAYGPEAFNGDRHQIRVAIAEASIKSTRRNLAMNGLDKRWATGYYPHASANVVTRDEPWFEAKNAIDGHLKRDGHGAWPYQSWGGGLRDDLEFMLEFGREVVIDEVILYLRADYLDNHDIHWQSGEIEFSDGSSMSIEMIKTDQGQSFSFEEKTVTWLKLHKLRRELSEAFSALTQIEVYGREA